MKRAIEVDGKTYDVELEPGEGGYVVSVPKLPGCNTEGDNLDHALEMAQDAIRAWRASAEAHGE